MEIRDWRTTVDDIPAPERTLDVSPDASGETWSLFAAGDVLYRNRVATDAPIGSKIASRLKDATLSMVNLEAPVAGHGDPLSKSGPTHDVDPEVPGVLETAGFDVATLANNHTMDYGSEGLAATVDACSDVGLETCGGGTDEATAMRPVRCDAGDTSVAVFSFCEREFGAAEADAPGTASLYGSEAIDRVEASDADVVVVAAHGGVEYVPFPPLHRQRRLRAFVDAGADLVLGHHPHVPQGWELYDDAPIFYSLGNFLFPMPNRPSTQWGLAVEVRFDESTVADVSLIPTETVDESVVEAGTHVDVDEKLAYLHRLAEVTANEAELEAYWQTIAVDVFRQRYTRWLRRAVAGDFASQLTTPSQHVNRGAIWDADEREPQMLALLNLLRNRSHRSLMETAIEVLTGKREDHRTNDTREAARALLDETEDEPVHDRDSPVRETIGAVLSKLS